MFLYISSEIQFCKGLSGSPIIQNRELIGVHFVTVMDDEKIGVGSIFMLIKIAIKLIIAIYFLYYCNIKSNIN